MKQILNIVTGAPGVGKTSVVTELLQLKSQFVIFDIDWLADSASELSGKSIYTDSSTWKAYSALWFEVLHSICKNEGEPIFFTPNNKEDFVKFGTPEWVDGINWLLLDCDEKTRRARLAERNWDNERIQEALDDADHFRKTIDAKIDTGLATPKEIAKQVVDYFKKN